MSMIGISHLTRDFGGGKGVFDLSLEIEKGEAFGFLGPNGAGKTTTIRHLMGFIRAQGGTCSIGGRDCWKDADTIQKTLGYIPGEIAFFEEMSGNAYLAFLRSYRGMKDEGRTSELLERFELQAGVRIKKMSKGMKQKLGIVAAFMHDPDTLILDEPTSGLDPLMQSRFVELVREEKARGKTILLSSHMFEEVERTCDRIGMIRGGRLAALDSAQALRARHVKTYVVTLASEQEARAFAEDFGGRWPLEDARQVEVTARQSLEEIFMHYYGGGPSC